MKALSPLAYFLALLAATGCQFNTSGPFSPPEELGASCFLVSTRFVPAPNGITSQPGTAALPATIAQCKEYAESHDISWTFEALAPPTPQTIQFPLTQVDPIQLVIDEDGAQYCVLRRALSYDFVEETGLGPWQVTHQVGDWSVTCPEVEITQCATEHNAVDYWASFTTAGKGECSQQKIGVDIMEPAYP